MKKMMLAAAAVVMMAACASEDALDEEMEHTSSEISATVRVEMHFSDPLGSDKERLAILDHVVRLIDDTPKGETIRMALHSISVNRVAKALTDAKARGVHVFVAHNGENFTAEDATPKQLAKDLGAASHRWCGKVDTGGKGGGCISNNPSSLMHSKLLLITKTKNDEGKLESNVSWFGSANMTNATGANSYNDTVTVYGDNDLHDGFVKKYFDKLWGEDHFTNNDFYQGDNGRGLIESSASGVAAHASPNQDGDLYLRRLESITPGPGCEVMVAQAMIFDSRLDLSARLVELKAKKCDVRVVGNDIQPKSLALLKSGGVPIHDAKTHDKLVIIHAKYSCGSAAECAKASPKKLVFTGSHNWTASANEINDELLVRVSHPAAYKPFTDHFERMWKRGNPR